MSTGTEHYLEAERLLRRTRGMFADDPAALQAIQLAQVHATLALGDMCARGLLDIAGVTAVTDGQIARQTSDGAVALDPADQQL